MDRCYLIGSLVRVRRLKAVIGFDSKRAALPRLLLGGRSRLRNPSFQVISPRGGDISGAVTPHHETMGRLLIFLKARMLAFYEVLFKVKSTATNFELSQSVDPHHGDP